MNKLKSRIHDEANGLDYILVGDYYIPAIELPGNDDRPIGKWGQMHRAYLEGVTEDLERRAQWEWVRAMNSIVNRAEEIIRREMIYV